MMKSFKKQLSLIVITLTITSANAQIDTAALSAKLNQAKSKLGKDIAVALYKDGKIIYKKETPEYNIRIQQPIDAASQWLTAALVMIHVQEGKLSLDDKVSTYIPLFAKHGKAYITIRHCLTHNTGIEAGKFYQKGNFKTLEEEVNTYASKREIETNPGTEFKYSNMGSRIAARVLEIVTKKPFERLMAEKLTRPLAMRATNFSTEKDNEAPDPSVGAKSSPGDIANFLAMILNKGTFNNKQVLTPESVKTLLTLHATADKEKNTPSEVQGFDFAVGSWAAETNGNEATALVTSSYDGVWATVDVCRGYGLVIFAKTPTKDLNKNVFLGIKQVIDEGVASNGK